MTAKAEIGNGPVILQLLDEILNHQIANRGSEHAFYRCCTYRSGQFPPWVAKAEAVVQANATRRNKDRNEH